MARSIADIGAELRERRQTRTYASTRLVSRYLDVSEAKVRQLEQGEEFDGWREVARRYRTILPILEDQAYREQRLSDRITAANIELQNWTLAGAQVAINLLADRNLITLPASFTQETLRQEIQRHILALIMGYNIQDQADSQPAATEENASLIAATTTEPTRLIRRTPANSTPLNIPDEEDDEEYDIDFFRRIMNEN